MIPAAPTPDELRRAISLLDGAKERHLAQAQTAQRINALNSMHYHMREADAAEIGWRACRHLLEKHG